MVSEQEINIKPISEATENSMKARINELRDFKLKPDNVETFYKVIREDRRSFETQIQVMTERFTGMEEDLNKQIRRPEVRNEDWSQNIWNGFFLIMEEIKNTNINISLIKSWMLGYQEEAINQLYSYAKLLNKQFLEIEKMKAETGMMDKFIDLIKTDKLEWMKNYYGNIEDRFNKLNEIILKLNGELQRSESQLKVYMDDFKNMKKTVNDLQSKQP